MELVRTDTKCECASCGVLDIPVNAVYMRRDYKCSSSSSLLGVSHVQLALIGTLAIRDGRVEALSLRREMAEPRQHASFFRGVRVAVRVGVGMGRVGWVSMGLEAGGHGTGCPVAPRFHTTNKPLKRQKKNGLELPAISGS